ncbi:hypothetical protein JDV02_009566 [Purpureocillium takamizusanense]|uniref:Uncharacterized protein n=1 Tax=Purpureocillium takamizusanense TaxID=2060973 RepID=A0A9Q8VED0_9HYPO|nr:uncharacterized protein JDV02_009566 [Purpureocillium takamizusanense]UNI23765.1 hypothetical protein JDV02_009566 [Purpureocillium takamizusanense]
MSSASAKAKAKLEEVLAAAKGDASTYPSNRVCVTRHPSAGPCDMTNTMSRRRSSTTSQGSASDGRVKTFLKSIVSPPAY